ncbi:MAG: hypothetical protein DRJ60_07295, partial [Thermoprotei archaeon]
MLNKTSISILIILILASSLVIADASSKPPLNQETYSLTIKVTTPCNITIYSQTVMPIFKAEVSNISAITLSLPAGMYLLAITSSCGSTLKCFFKYIELSSNVSLIARLNPLSSYQNRTLIVQVVYPNGTSASNIIITVYLPGTSKILYIA